MTVNSLNIFVEEYFICVLIYKHNILVFNTILGCDAAEFLSTRQHTYYKLGAAYVFFFSIDVLV